MWSPPPDPSPACPHARRQDAGLLGALEAPGAELTLFAPTDAAFDAAEAAAAEAGVALEGELLREILVGSLALAASVVLRATSVAV